MNLTGRLSKAFILVAALGVLAALYHAWVEGAFTTNYSAVTFSTFASFFGVPYWVFGVIWFPLLVVVGLWSTNLGRSDLRMELLWLLTVGNVFTGYLWYLDLEVTKAYTLIYVALYVINYVLTGLVVFEHHSSDVMRGYVYGTVTGGLVGVLFGTYGVAVCGIGGGIFGAIRNYVTPAVKSGPSPSRDES
jgi:uncharacterized membrane protein